MQGQSSDPVRARQLMDEDADKWGAFCPDMLGSVAIGHEDGGYTMVMYFTSEAEARDGERKGFRRSCKRRWRRWASSLSETPSTSISSGARSSLRSDHVALIAELLTAITWYSSLVSTKP